MREFVALIGFEEDESISIEEPGVYFEEEFGWLGQSGFSLNDWAILDDDDEYLWDQYIKYLIRWGIEHLSIEYKGMSPVCYDEWRNNENTTL